MPRRMVLPACVVLALLAGGPRSLAAGPAPGAATDAAPSAAPGAIGRPYFDRSGWVMLRSGLVPGWGQAKNGRWFKAAFVAGLEVALAERLFFEQGRVEYYRDRAAEAPGVNEDRRAYYESKVERHRAHRRDFVWWLSLAVAASMGDAYVDAQLRDFDVELQAEPEPDAAGGAGGIRLRLAVGRRF